MIYTKCSPLRLALRSGYIHALITLLSAKDKLFSIVFHSRMEMTKLLIAVSSLTWAFFLLEHTVLFTDSRTTYLVMRAIMPENVWGILFLISGLVGVWSVLLDTRNKITLAFDAFLGAALWTSSTLACFAAHWPHHVVGWVNQLAQWPAPAAMSGELWLSIAAWWCFVRHVIDNADCLTNSRKEDF